MLVRYWNTIASHDAVRSRRPLIMIGERKAMSIHTEILRLHSLGTGKKKIARALGISPTTVRGIIKSKGKIFTEKITESVPNVNELWVDKMQWKTIELELQKPYTTIKQLHQELAPEDVPYLKFWRALKKNTTINLSTKTRIRFHYKPGERFEIDYCDGFLVHDRKTGKTKKTHLFVCVSSSSDYVFGEFVNTQKSDEFISVQDRCFTYFGGIPESVIIDNLKSGVKKAHRYDPEINPVYFDYAKHMGFIVIPARPYTPRDKATVESTIGVIQRQFFAEFRNRIFYSLSEMNLVWKLYLEKLNSSIMKDYGVSRKERFELEKPALKPLPLNRYELAEYKTAKVHNDCHIQVNNNFYSLPYKLIGKNVRVKINSKLVEVFDCESYESITVHSKMKGRGEFSTNESHYPENKIISNRLDVLALKREAERICPELLRVVDHLLAASHPLRYFRRIQGLLRLSKAYTREAIIYACTQAFLFNRYDYNFIKNLASRHLQQRGRVIGLSLVPTRDLSSVFLKPTKTDEGMN